jgi:hypothetical protein
MARTLYVMRDFSGGINTDKAFGTLSDNELQTADNVLLTKIGALTHRGGTVAQTAGSFSGQVECVIPWLRRDGTERQMVVVGDTLKEVSGATVADVRAGVGTNIGHFVYRDFFYFTDSEGIDKAFLRWNGSDCAQVWPDPPEAPTVETRFNPAQFGYSAGQLYTISEVAAGNNVPVGEHRIRLSYYNSTTGEEMIGSPIQLHNHLDNTNDIHYTAPLLPLPSEYDTVRIYRAGPGMTTFHRVADQLSPPGFSLFVDDYTNAELEALPLMHCFPDSTYYAGVTFTNADGVESDVSPLATVAMEIGKEFNWTDVPLGDSSVVKRTLYRGKVADGSDLKRVQVIPDNSTATFTENVADADLGPPPTDWSTYDVEPIKKCKHLLWSPINYRVWASGNIDDPQALYYSEPGQPHQWKAISKLYPTTAEGPVTGLCLFADTVLAFYKFSVWRASGTSIENLTWHKLPIGVGTVSPETIKLTANSLTFLGSDGGLYAISPSVLDIPATFEAGQELVANIARSKVQTLLNGVVHRETACAVWDRRNEIYWLFYGDDSGNPRNNKALAYHWGLGAFTRITGWAVNHAGVLADGSLTLATNNYLMARDATGSDLDTSTGAKTVAVALAVKTKLTDFDLPQFWKNVRKIRIDAEQFTPATSVNVAAACSGYKEAQTYPSTALTLAADNFVPSPAVVSKDVKVSLKGSRIEVSLTHSSTTDLFTLYGIGFEYVARMMKGQ